MLSICALLTAVAGVVCIASPAPRAWAQASAPTTAPAAEPANTAPKDEADPALAERFAQMAQLNLATHPVDEVTLSESAALLQAACRLNPQEPRFPKLLAEAELQLRDADAALKAFTTYLNIDSIERTGDRQVAIQVLDLYASQMETADRQLAFYEDKANTSQLAAEVRAHAAVKAAQLLRDRGEDEKSSQMLDQAIRLNALNIDALWMNYDRAVDTGGVYERVAALIGLLRANPTNPDVMSRLAAELGDAGLPTESLSWYGNAFALANRAGRPLSPVAFIDSTAEAFLAGQIRQADQAISQMLQSDPTAIDGWYMKLLASRQLGETDAFTKALESARTGGLERLYAIHRVLNKGADPAGTQPTGDLSARLPKLDEDEQSLKQAGNPQLSSAYEQALTDLAWLEIYFANKPAEAAPLLDALRKMLPPDNVTVPRLEGWSFLQSNKPDEAKVKLSAVADRDPLAKMGLLRLEWAAAGSDADAKDRIRTQARELVNKNASGLLGAVLFDGLREQGGAIVAGNNAEAIKEVLGRFPKAWLDIIDKPQQFYSIMVDPLKVAHEFDEPMLANLTVRNLSEFDLTVGPDGVLRPDLWFDAKMTAPQTQQLAGVAFDRIGKVVLLRPGQTTSQIIRLDQGKLSDAIAQNPLVSVQLYFSVVTNPGPGGGGGVVPGPAGYRQQVRRVLERDPTPLARPQTMKELSQTVTEGTAEQKIRTLSLLTAIVQGLSRAEGNQQAQAIVRDMTNLIDQATHDASPGVRAWATYLFGAIQPADKQGEALQRMAGSSSWLEQMLALSVAGSVPRDTGKTIDQPLLDASDPLVKRYAQAVAEELKRPPATRPTTAPAAATERASQTGNGFGIEGGAGAGAGTTPPPPGP